MKNYFIIAAVYLFSSALLCSCKKRSDDTPPPTAFISKVFEYQPATGQFINTMPEFISGMSKADMISKAEKCIAGQKMGIPISLGSFGGYVVFGFDHTIVNVVGKRDFRIMGNAFYSDVNPQPEASRSGNCEPGIVMVSQDINKNKLPDDIWYEIAGSEYNKTSTIKNYQITYHRPETENPIDTKKYIRWEDNQGNGGYKEKNTFHNQSYYPQWTLEDKITFKGTLLANNAINESQNENAPYWVLYSYGHGYADNATNNDDDSAIDISWAVSSTGQQVNLTGIDFVKVYTGVNQEAGWLGETSTEISGAYDLHMVGESISSK